MIDSRIKEALISEMLNEGIFDAQRNYKGFRRNVRNMGKEMFKVLNRSEFGKNMPLLLEVYPSNNPKREIERILGFGASLTEYLISTFRIEEERHQKIIEIGGVVNLLVTVFDALSEHDDRSSEQWIPAYTKALNRLLKGQRIFKFRYSSHSELMLLLALTEHYFNELKRIGSQENMHSMNRYIVRMYEAQLKTLGSTKTTDLGIIQRKSALPFIVMGLPSTWLDHETASSFYSHLRWMYRIGKLIGHLDDLADLNEDDHNENVNVFLSQWNGNTMPTDQQVKDVVSELMKELKSIVDYSEKANSSLNESNRSVNYLFVALVSWMGGVPEKIQPTVMKVQTK